MGTIASQLGMNGNICEDPLYCHPQSDTLTIWDNSPCAPFAPQHPQCDLVGAWPIGCRVGAAEPPVVSLGMPGITAIPNPARGAATVSWRLPDAWARKPMSVIVCDAGGRAIRQLYRGEARGGMEALRWDGADDSGRPVAQGAYFLKLEVGGQRMSTRLVVAR